MNLYDIVNSTQYRAGRIFDRAVVSLIVMSILLFSFETLPDLPSALRPFLSYSEGVITILFTVEYALRVFVAPKKRAYAASTG